MASSRQQCASSSNATQTSATEAVVRQFKVHKLILSGQSEWFVDATKPDAFVEGSTNIIAMTKDNPEAVKAMLDVLYKGNYEIATGTNPNPNPNANDEMDLLMKHLHIYALADQITSPT
ncbi:hypothetical protein E2P81_ATG02926 [Venturia nashicola]|uniref:BTB domain-containing protein n=1 Tax=Venturia nashicola TaxID=86259 RepID=A0A4Z1P3F2_9PEZI|nr:hypothetical protein E6O75_ATG02989 [Venturia nashicola]TLD36037.1 hypothetical protein E2P81_ATG02926 [Venturia nashicola]